MQNFALDGGALNGESEVWFDNSSASVALQGSGIMAIGLSVVGTAQVVLSSSLPISIRVMLVGYAPVHAEAAGGITYGLGLGGLAGVYVGASGDVLRWSMLQASGQVHVNTSGDVAVVSPISAMFNVQLLSGLDLYVAKGSLIEGSARVVVSSNLYGRPAYGARIEGLADIQLASKGAGYLFVKSPPGMVEARISGFGELRYGGIVQGSGIASIGMFAAGSLGSNHYVYAGGSAKIQVDLIAKSSGIPSIPSYYIQAPAARYMVVDDEPRLFAVQAERRL